MKRILSCFLALFMLISCVPAGALQVSAEEIYRMDTQTAAVDPGLPESEQLLEGYAYQLFYGSITTYGRKAGDRLTGDEKLIYDALVPIIRQIAAGERTSTVIGLGSEVTCEGQVYYADAPLTFTVSVLTQENLDRIISALLTDLPYEMYWHDKVTGVNTVSVAGGVIINLQLSFSVAGNYRGDDIYTVDCAQARAAVTAAAKSAAVLEKYAASTDYEKLLGYKTEICALTDYDYHAAFSGNFSYDNDPWQLIYVFDGDQNTKVVCEGYSKAFSYLCEQTEFAGDVSCILVTGQMGGPHMWNIVSIEGNNYLADVTNSEPDTVGSDGSLFLAGATGSIAEGYRVGQQEYTYADYDIDLWGTGADSVLALAAQTYVPGTAHVHSYSQTIVPPTCTEPGYTVYTCSCDDTYTADPVDALGHAYGDWVDVSPATCKLPGTQNRTCGRCGAIQAQNVPATGHSYSKTVVEPDYTTQGYTLYTCHCGDTYTADVTDVLELPAPTLTAEGGSLYWEYEGPVQQFDIYRATSKTGKYTLVASVAESSWQDRSATVGKTYYYKIKSVCDAEGIYSSDFSNTVSLAAKCAAPDLQVHADSATGKVVATWQKVTGAKKYELWRATSVDGKYTKLTTTTKLTYTDTKAAIGVEYYYKVKAVASKSTYNSDFSGIWMSYAICAKPSVSAKADAATGKPVLTWKAISGAQGYQILRQTGAEEFVPIAVCEGLTWQDTSAVLDTEYTYKIQALGADYGCDSAYSNAVEVTCGLAYPSFSAAVNDDGKPVITWEAVEGAVSYNIYRSTSATKSYKLVYTTAELTYTDDSVAAGKTYYYKLEAVGENSKSAQSAYAKLTGKCGIPELAVKAGSTGKPVLTWNKISGAKKYEIWRSVDGAAFKKLTTVTKTTYTDTKATEGAECTYKVKALGSKSTYNGNFSAVDGCYVTCAAPTLTVKIDTATGKPSLSWKKITGAAGYEIWRSENGGQFQKLTEVTELTYLDEATDADNSYTYYVVTVGKAEVFNSVASGEKTVTVTVGQPKPVGSINEQGKAVITWEAVEDAVKYEVYRSTKSNKSYKLVDTVTELTYTDTGITAGKTYYYKVVAAGANSKSAQSAYVKLTGKCAQPVISAGFHQDSGKPVINWEKISGAKKYEVWRSTDGVNFTKLTTTTKLTYTDTKAPVGTFCYYQVKALGSKSSYNSVFSKARGCLCVCAKPVVTVKMDAQSWQPALNWKPVEGAVAYEVYRALRGGNFVLVATVTDPAYLDQTAQIGNLYRYKVKAVSTQQLSNMEGEQVLFSVPCEKVTLTAVTNSDGKPSMSWQATEGATVYAVYRSTKKSSGYTMYRQVVTTSFTDKNAKKGTTYYYYVTALAQDTESAASNTLKIKCTK